MKKQIIKSFFKPVSTNSNVAKETNRSKQQLLRYPVNLQEVRKLTSSMKNQINLIEHLCFQKLLLLNKTDHANHSGLQNLSG